MCGMVLKIASFESGADLSDGIGCICQVGRRLDGRPAHHGFSYAEDWRTLNLFSSSRV